MAIQVLILVPFICMLILLKLAKKAHPSNLPPGPWKLPLIGNMHNLIGFVPHHALHHLSLIYGPVMHLQLGELSTVAITSADAAKQVMRTHDINFASRPPIAAAEIMGYNCTGISFSVYGDYWRQIRKICTLELLSMKCVRSFRFVREQVFLYLMRRIASNEGLPVNLSEMLYSSMYAVTSRGALGKKTEEQHKLLEILKEALGLSAGFYIADVYPSNKLLRMTSLLRRRLKKLHREADEILKQIINEHRTATDEGGGKQEDLVDVLLKFQDEGLDLPLTTDNVKSVITDIMGAGSETSSTMMDWAISEMIKNPTVMERHNVR